MSPTVNLSFRVEPSFKQAIDIEVARRRSTLRREGIAALAQHLGIDMPEGQPCDSCYNCRCQECSHEDCGCDRCGGKGKDYKQEEETPDVEL